MTTNSDSAEDALGGTDRNLQLIIDTIPALGLVGAPDGAPTSSTGTVWTWLGSQQKATGQAAVCVSADTFAGSQAGAVSSSWSLEVHWQREVRQPHGIQRIVASSRGAG